MDESSKTSRASSGRYYSPSSLFSITSHIQPVACARPPSVPDMPLHGKGKTEAGVPSYSAIQLSRRQLPAPMCSRRGRVQNRLLDETIRTLHKGILSTRYCEFLGRERSLVCCLGT
ncbi:hypothetical protein RvY_09116-1 [Ramazzottius varieornatus]|uniref:Uncharacterized protein n=1 Tax=Ramazzottius varieornatus TaxID=947166 RepID=A0A1D1V868_RAMVA|nr:hypothetical protein RvY_09116-1 [Ramazzottius varieornatus]